MTTLSPILKIKFVTLPNSGELPAKQSEPPATEICEAATNEDRPGLPESPLDDDAPTERRPKRQTRVPKRFGDYHLY